MGVFDTATRVKRIVEDPRTDHKLPHPASLSWEAISGPTALPDTTGVHCELVHGDRSYQINGNHTESVTASQKHTVGGNQTMQVGGNHKETIVGTCSQSIIGPHLVVNHAVRNETALAAYTKTFGDFEQHDDNSGHFMYADALLERTYFLGNIELIEMDLAGIGVYAQGASASGVALADIEWKTIHMEEHVVHHEEHAFTSDFHLVKAEVKAVEANACGCKASLGPHVGAPPHGPLMGAA